MKQILFLSLIFALSCSSQKETKNFREISSLKTSFSEQEIQIDLCLQKYDSCSLSDLECQEDQAISCASDYMSKEEVQKIQVQVSNLKMNNTNLSSFNWFFLSPSKISRALRFIKDLSRSAKLVMKKAKSTTLNSLHGQGIGFSAAAYLGEGRNFHMETMIFNKELSLYCAPGLMYTPDIGIQAGVSRTMALGCSDKESYEGQFVSLSAGISLTNFAIPMGIDAAYSFGFDTKNLIKKIKSSDISFKPLIAELLILQKHLPQYIINNRLNKNESKAIQLGLHLGGKSLGDDAEDFDLSGDFQASNLDLSNFTKNNSLGKLAKKIIGSPSFNQFLTRLNLPHSKNFFSAVSSSFTGCDSISATISAAISLIPINLSVSSTLYTSLYNINLDKVLSMKNLSAFVMMNPIFMDTYTIAKVIEVATLLENFPTLVSNQCYNEDYEYMTKTLSLGQNIFD